jgi:hypothetical protein
MKKITILIIVTLISIGCFSQSKPADSTYVPPKVYVLKFTQAQMDILTAIVSNQDFSRKQFQDFLEELNRQINSQLVKVPVKKEEIKK